MSERNFVLSLRRNCVRVKLGLRADFCRSAGVNGVAIARTFIGKNQADRNQRLRSKADDKSERKQFQDVKRSEDVAIQNPLLLIKEKGRG